MKKLITILLLASCSAFGQSKHPDTLQIMQPKGLVFSQGYNLSVMMSIDQDSSIVITGDTIKVVRMLLKYYEESQREKEAANELLTFYQVDDIRAKHYTAYRNALIQYFKLKKDNRYKSLIK